MCEILKSLKKKKEGLIEPYQVDLSEVNVSVYVLIHVPVYSSHLDLGLVLIVL